MYKLRKYQAEARDVGLNFILNEEKAKKKRPSLLVLPTAAGKSILIAEIANPLTEKSLVLQPTKELLEQNLSKLQHIGGSASVYSASMKTKEFGHLTYGTIGSVVKAGAEFKRMGYKYLIMDEADRYPRTIDGMFNRFLKTSGIEIVLGLTATPFKLDSLGDRFGNSYSILRMLTSTTTKRGKVNFFKDIIHVTQIQDLVKEGYWAKLIYETYDVDTGKLEYNSTGADYTDKSLEEFYENQGIETKIINRIRESDRKSILVFVNSVDEAIELSKKIPNSAAVWGNMNPKDREIIINGFKNRLIRVVINVNVLSVGFDSPNIDMIIGGRPTASLGWQYQALGRGTRIEEGKENCLIVDFAGNIKKFGKIEDIYYKKIGGRWYIFGGGGVQMSNIDLSLIGSVTEQDLIEAERVRNTQMVGENVVFTFGKYVGKAINTCPRDYLSWALRNVSWNTRTNKIRQEIEKVLN